MDIQVKAGNTDTNEGILIPRVNKARVKAISSTNRVEGTLVYVTDAVQDSDNATFTGTGKGFYYYDAATQRWVKMGSGAATAPAPKAVVDAFSSPTHTISDDATFAIFTPNTGTSVISFGTSSPNGRNVCIWNSSSDSNLTFTVQPPGQQGVVYPNTGACYTHYNGVWYSGASY
ncbi:hypothetical protein [Bergeyella zoohelcum]|uniref:hypothetical protein n=1 Tax=Bergeyella zoohelcum TaxID=1015 RepID=UPI002A917E2C|nr:hypothetical protein [Bergeyella zoohelcum]MDY6025373.1 hypothetical protein [Bergeyella zoohelcum]